jgi:hypothetical protein
MKYLLLLMVLSFPLNASDSYSASQSTTREESRIPIVRHSIDHKAEAEGLRGELDRTKSYHKEQMKSEKCKSLTAALTACGSFLGAVASFIYSVKKCS